jgi:hypothetical protein
MVFILLIGIFFEGGGGAFFDGVEEIADFAFVGGDHAFEDRAAGAGAAGDEDLLENCGRGGDDMRLLGKIFEERSPILDTVVGDA